MQDRDFTLHVGDVRDVLPSLPPGSVDCVVTSPPYWGLRDYGTSTWEGGDPACQHMVRRGGTARTTLHLFGSRLTPETAAAKMEYGHPQYRALCKRCGATRIDRQLGLEDEPDEYVENIVAIFREVWRVLAPHGIVWLNLGDTYASNGREKSSGNARETREAGMHGSFKTTPSSLAERSYAGLPNNRPAGVKPKDLVGIPWRVAFALQADGWWLRSDVVWSKPNPMPESVTDRPTKAHEYVFMLTKSGAPSYYVNALRGAVSATRPAPDYWWLDENTGEFSQEIVTGWKRVNAWRGRDYFFDQEAVREPFEARPQQRLTATVEQPLGPARVDAGVQQGDVQGGRHVSRFQVQQETLDGSPGERPRGPDGRRKTEHDHATPHSHSNHAQMGDGHERWPNPGGRNVRSVWEIATQPYPEAHFATFPQGLVERCVKAGCPAWVCRACGKPRERIVGRLATGYDGSRYGERVVEASGGALSGGTSASTLGSSNGTMTAAHETVGWASCACADYRPGVVLDIFMGSGTTALVARRLGRHAVGIELNEKYAALSAQRLQQLSLLAEVGQ